MLQGYGTHISIYSNIMKPQDDNNILCDKQHDFQNNRSCESQFLITNNDFAAGMNDKQQIDSILTFQKL